MLEAVNHIVAPNYSIKRVLITLVVFYVVFVEIAFSIVSNNILEKRLPDPHALHDEELKLYTDYVVTERWVPVAHTELYLRGKRLMAEGSPLATLVVSQLHLKAPDHYGVSKLDAVILLEDHLANYPEPTLNTSAVALRLAKHYEEGDIVQRSPSKLYRYRSLGWDLDNRINAVASLCSTLPVLMLTRPLMCPDELPEVEL